MIRKSAAAWLALALFSVTGCTAIQDHCISAETSARNCVLVEKAWLQWSKCYDHLDNKPHFAKGFKDGYQNILEGGKGCQPTLPPRWYWKPCYQTPSGRCKTMAWFDGFSHGAAAAQQDGLGNLQQLPISPTARANMMTRLAPASAACFAGMSQGETHGEISNPETYPQIHRGFVPEEPPMDLLMSPDADDQLGESPIELPRPYDEGTGPAAN